MGGQAAALAFFAILLETRALLGRGGELVKAVRQLDAVQVQLEAQGRGGIVGIQAGQRGLRSRIVVDEA